jgi:hypothetical protein
MSRHSWPVLSIVLLLALLLPLLSACDELGQLGEVKNTLLGPSFDQDPSGSGPELWHLRKTLHNTYPEPREQAAAAYISGADRMAVFGGKNRSSYFNDLWLFTAAHNTAGTASWVGITPWTERKPEARYGSILAYHSEKDTLILFGGRAGETIFFDLWTFSGGAGLTGEKVWTRQNVAGTAPSVRSGMSGVYDPARDVLMMFGGWAYSSSGYRPFNETWLITGVTSKPAWQRLDVSGTPPPARALHTSVYDDRANTLIIFGGNASEPDSTQGKLKDAWVLSNANGNSGAPAWKEVVAAGGPAARDGHSAVYDPASQRMVVFGGAIASRNLWNDLWVLSLKGAPAWSQYPTGPPRPVERAGHAAAYSGVTNVLTLFGGIDKHGYLLNDTWSLQAANGMAP